MSTVGGYRGGVQKKDRRCKIMIKGGMGEKQDGEKIKGRAD